MDIFDAAGIDAERIRWHWPIPAPSGDARVGGRDSLERKQSRQAEEKFGGVDRVLTGNGGRLENKDDIDDE
jgi:hypothetical protein